jgi:3-oxoisoapionate decarboxylase
MAAMSPLARAQAAGGPRLLLGYDTYSIRNLRWKAAQVLEHAAALKLDVVMMAPPCFDNLEEASLLKVKEQADRLGVKAAPSLACICPRSKAWRPKQVDAPTYLRECIRITKTLGSPFCRVLMGVMDDRKGAVPIAQMMEETIKALREVRQPALDAGVKIALENHGDMQAWQMRDLIEAAGKDFVATCFDAGNPVMMLEDPLAALEILGPYAAVSHIRDSVVYESAGGATFQWLALGDGMIDFKKFVSRFAELCPKAPFLFETITGRAPQEMAYLEPEFWKEHRDARAPDFARFLALAKKGHPFTGKMLVVPDGPVAKDKLADVCVQQQVDLERSIGYAKKTLDVGVRWKG